jgi:flagellar biosynthesis/type III secretory pathway M-ring protein FliF/YscJ
MSLSVADLIALSVINLPASNVTVVEGKTTLPLKAINGKLKVFLFAILSSPSLVHLINKATKES